ncbi:hypothetical protein [Pseudotabrizicola sp.]|uniref:hypothetical protein n=1 Tax=Pseudotabrizicola sp. TaxID=2939647 RepID=UPI00272B19E5|nr:hypothetical protein [Pseudotabrizicola sp.]
MATCGPCRRHSTPFRLRICLNIKAGIVGRRGAQRRHSISANLIQLWLSQFDRGALKGKELGVNVIAEYEARIAAQAEANSEAIARRSGDACFYRRGLLGSLARSSGVGAFHLHRADSGAVVVPQRLTSR